MKKLMPILVVSSLMIPVSTIASEKTVEAVTFCIIDNIDATKYDARNIPSIENEIQRTLATKCRRRFEKHFSAVKAQNNPEHELAISTKDSARIVKERAVGAISAVLAPLFYRQ